MLFAIVDQRSDDPTAGLSICRALGDPLVILLCMTGRIEVEHDQVEQLIRLIFVEIFNLDRDLVAELS